MSSPTAAVSNPSRTVARAGSFDWFLTLALVACAAASVRALFFTPVDAMLGAAQKIFYVHVPSAIVGLYLACGILAISSVMYLWIRDERLDRLAESSAEVGLVFMGIVLVTGPVWARTSWGTWWVWEARITSTSPMNTSPTSADDSASRSRRSSRIQRYTRLEIARIPHAR